MRRFVVMLLVFIMAGPTIVGSLIIPLTDPAWGFDAEKLMPYIVGGGFLVALPISYILSGMITRQMDAARAK